MTHGLGLPTHVVKVIYKPESFTKEENDRGNFNLVHNIYFYEQDSLQYMHQRMTLAWRKDCQMFMMAVDYEPLALIQSPKEILAVRAGREMY